MRNEVIYMLMCADDQVVLALEDLRYMVRKLVDEFSKNELEINIAKIEYLATRKKM